MANGVEPLNITSSTDAELLSVFDQARERLNDCRSELHRRGWWVDAKYEVKEFHELDGEHLHSIYRFLKNRAMRNRSYQDWQSALKAQDCYIHLFREASSRNLRGIRVWPTPEDS